MISHELVSSLSETKLVNVRDLAVLSVENDLKMKEAGSSQVIRFKRQHEFFEDGDLSRHFYIRDVLTSIGKVKETSKLSLFCCQTAGCSHVFDTLESYEHHYNTMHRNVCTTCKHFFPTARLLDIHIFECHNSIFEIMAGKGNMYQCLVEGCAENFKNSMERENHLVTMHLYPSDFHFDKTKKSRRIPSTICFGQGAVRGFSFKK
ncbi:hypothetical protein XENTR_v10018470 [Xenopus tropicalis]|nr:hypothetical protein XENTR_v10018470 [Xenopus tropicalis]